MHWSSFRRGKLLRSPKTIKRAQTNVFTPQTAETPVQLIPEDEANPFSAGIRLCWYRRTPPQLP